MVKERKITTHAGLAFMAKLGVENLPTICVDGVAEFISIMPDNETLRGVLRSALAEKEA